jgi:hypothetical protein
MPADVVISSLSGASFEIRCTAEGMNQGVRAALGSHALVLGRRGNARSGPWNPLSVAVTLAAPEQSDAAVSWCDLSCGAQPRDGGLRVGVAAHPQPFEDR